MTTEVPTDPEVGERMVILGADDELEPDVTETLSNVAVARLVLLPLLTIRPT